MKIRCSLLLLAILTNATFLCVLPTEVKAVNDIIMQEEKTELTMQEKEKIFNDLQQEVAHYGITLNHKQIINNNLLNLANNLFQKNAEEQQNILSQISAFTWLKKLWLFNNELTSIPDTIFNLTKLTALYLGDNRFKSISDTIGNLIHLNELTLYNNKLKSLPDTIFNLTKLLFIDLHDNELTSIPDTIGNLKELTHLHLKGNELISIPASIQNIPNLIVFDLQENPHLLPSSDNPLQWGKAELRAHFGNRVLLDKPSIKRMPGSTTKEFVYEALDENPLRIKRDVYTDNKLPDIQVEKVFQGEEMLQTLVQIITSMNFTDDQKPGYLSYEMLANDFASDAKNQNLSNVEKVWQFLMPRLTGYIRT
ncbi:MAG: leucine-rich repeat domain-containing protein, partial [Alphaproteobacteria bacterium]|nr:leucine-rich repeat domain-containing protein [Alphaproteobacteria bacterium]